MLDRLDHKAIQRVSGPAWNDLRPTFIEISRILLSVDPETNSEMTTIYVKYMLSKRQSSVYAVVWLNSKQLVVGFSLPQDFSEPSLASAPNRMKYKGLTKYVTIRKGDKIPNEFNRWAKIAYQNVLESMDADEN